MILENVLTCWATVRFSTRTSLCRKLFFFQFEIILSSALFWDVTQLIIVIPCRRFGTIYRSCLLGSRNPRI